MTWRRHRCDVSCIRCGCAGAVLATRVRSVMQVFSCESVPGISLLCSMHVQVVGSCVRVANTACMPSLI